MSKVLCTVCARGGSKGVPNKNIREVAGKPLVGHAICDIRNWDGYDEVIVSTDSEEIASVAKEYGAQVPFKRPQELASDEAGKLPVIKHALKQMESNLDKQYDYVVDVDATTPLREPEHIEDCFNAVAEHEQTTNAYTVCEADKNPYFNMVEIDEDGYASLSKELDESVVRRQDAPAVYEMNAAVYVYEREYLLNTTTHHGEYTRVSVMPPERSVDIDTELDLQLVKFLAENQGIKP